MLEAREAAPSGVVGGAEAVEDDAGFRIWVAVDDDPGHFDTVQVRKFKFSAKNAKATAPIAKTASPRMRFLPQEMQ